MVDISRIRDLLGDARTYAEITQLTGASSATIAKVAKEMRNAQVANGVEPTIDQPVEKIENPEKQIDILSSVDELYAWAKELKRLCRAFRSPKCPNYSVAYMRLEAWRKVQPGGPL